MGHISLPQGFVLNSIDLALFILGLEAMILIVLRVSKGRGLSIATVLLISFSGIGLLLALRASITGADPGWILLSLSLGGLMHMLDLMRRLKKSND